MRLPEASQKQGEVMRHTWRHFDYSAHCQNCGWHSNAVNALGNAARHHDRTGHTISVDVTGGVTYCGDEENQRRKMLKGASNDDLPSLP